MSAPQGPPAASGDLESAGRVELEPVHGVPSAASVDEQGGAASGSGTLFSVFRFTAGTSALTILMGLVTNKIVALVTGTQGVAVLALYRSLTSTATVALSPSSSTLVVQRVSTTKTLEGARQVLRATWLLFLLQVLALGAVALFGAGHVAALMFEDRGAQYTTEVRVVLVLVSGVLGLRLVTALLNGRVRVRESMGVNFLSSALTLVAVYPLLLLGDIGLAMVIGLTCGISAAVGGWYVWREYDLSPSDLGVSRRQLRALRGVPVSLALNVHIVVGTAAIFAVQFIINRHYGTSALGLYTAAAMLESSLIQVLSSAMVPYYLPSLARMETQEEKSRLVNRMLALVLCVSIPAVLFLNLAGGLLIPLLFSGEFAPAERFIPVMGIAVLAQCVVWCHAVFLQHKGAFRTYLALDSVWASLLVGGVLLSTRRSWPLDTVVWIYAFSYSTSALLYLANSLRVYGRGLLDRRLGLLLMFLAASAGAFFVGERPVVLQWGLAVAGIGAFLLYRKLQEELVWHGRGGNHTYTSPS